MKISSFQNPRVKEVVRLRRRPHRDEDALLLVEGYREVARALDNQYPVQTLFFCPELFLGSNENKLMEQCTHMGAETIECSEPVFRKMAYRDRPDGLLALGPLLTGSLDDLTLPDNPLILVVESIEKPGNLGTMLRSADAAGVDAVIVCDRCTDINNPNVVRASIGTLFSRPVIEGTTREVIAWLKDRGIKSIAATPQATNNYTAIDMSGPAAIVVGSEQYGLHEAWLKAADEQVFIPMRGQCDSLNVSSAAAILLYEAVRQRS